MGRGWMQVAWLFQGAFVLSQLEGAVLRMPEGWGLAFGTTCPGTELILGFLAGNTPSYMSPQAG